MSIDEYEQKYHKHLIFLYNNLRFGEDSIIDNEEVEELYKMFEKLNNYDKINLVVETGGGNLAAGTRLVYILKQLYNKYEVTILNRCNSTGTLIALGASQISVLPKSLITPCEPLMEYNDSNISTSIIRNYLENVNNLSCQDNMIVLGSYYAKINYFKDLCNSIFDSKKAEIIYSYMLNKINSHQFPISLEELNKIHGNVTMIDKYLQSFYLKEDEEIRNLFDTIENDDSKEKKLTIIRSKVKTRAYCKSYNKVDNKYYKSFEGYKDI